MTFSYDDFGRLESTTGPNNATTTYSYDLLGRRTGVSDPSGSTTFEYDRWDHLTALIDAENQRTEFEYYPDGKLKIERRPMMEETRYEYDALGRVWKTIDARNQSIEYGYDTQGRLERITRFNASGVQNSLCTLNYDADGNLAGYNDGTTSATYTHDALGRKLTETVNYGPFSKRFEYTYYGNGLKQTFTAPDNTVYTYTYGSNNELREVQIPGVGSIAIPHYTWNHPQTMTFPGGTQRNYTYDALMRLESLTVTDSGSTPLLNYQYTYDDVGNILTKVTEHGSYSYDYDASSRLTLADNPTLADESYTYDDVGNRLTSADVSGNWSYNLNNELLGYADVEYDYDDNGNLTEVRVGGTIVWTYSYDVANRLTHAEDGTGNISANYYYDPFGRRLWKEVNGTKTYFFYSDEGLIAEYDENGVENRSYGYKPDSTWTTDPLFLKKGGNYYWYQNDHLGTPQKLVDVNGAVVWSAQYAAFGKAIIDIKTVTNNLRFPGQYYDAETGLHYNFNRYYYPKIGRYISADLIGFDGGDMNLYVFVFNNPLTYKDIYGLQATSHLWCCPDENKYTGCCGPDATDAIREVLQNIRDVYDNVWEDGQRWAACTRIIGFEGGTTVPTSLQQLIAIANSFNPGIAEVGWDIAEFHLMTESQKYNPSSEWQNVKDGEGEPECRQTVAFDERCYHMNYINYVMWGAMNQRCYKTFKALSIPHEAVLTPLIKAGFSRYNIKGEFPWDLEFAISVAEKRKRDKFSNEESIPEVRAAIVAGYRDVGVIFPEESVTMHTIHSGCYVDKAAGTIPRLNWGWHDYSSN